MFPQDVIANAPRIISDLQAIFPPQDGHVPDRPDGQARLGRADAGQPVARRDHRDSAGRHRDSRRAEAGAAGRRTRHPRSAGELRRRARVRQAARCTSSPRSSTRTSCSSRSRARWACCSPGATTRTSWSRSAASIRSSIRRRCRFRRRAASQVDIINESYARIRCDGYFAVTTNTVQFGSHSELLLRLLARSVVQGTPASTR